MTLYPAAKYYFTRRLWISYRGAEHSSTCCRVELNLVKAPQQNRLPKDSIHVGRGDLLVDLHLSPMQMIKGKQTPSLRLAGSKRQQADDYVFIGCLSPPDECGYFWPVVG